MGVGESCSGDGASSSTTHWDVMCLVTALSSAASEWFLILLLFIHGLLSYFLREFARYCKLPTPCLLCSRLDHYFSNNVPESYQSLFCKNHGLEIFSHVVCDDCLFSCSAKESSISDSQRLLMNKMSKSLGQNKRFNSGNEESTIGPIGKKACLCCGKNWTSRKAHRGEICYRSPVRESSKPSVPLPNVPSRKNLNFRDKMRRKREKSYGSLYSNHLWNDIMDPSANTGFRAVKVASDSEAEAPFSDGGDGIFMILEAKTVREDNELRRTSHSLADAQSNVLAHLKPASKSFIPANVSADERAAEVKLSGGVQTSSPLALPELLTLDDNPSMDNLSNGNLLWETTGKDSSKVFLTPTYTPVIQQDTISFADPCPSAKQIELSVEDSSEKFATASINGMNHENVKHLDTLRATLTTSEDQFNDGIPSVANEHVASYDSPSLPYRNKGLETSALEVKDIPVKIHNRSEEESQLSATNEYGLGENSKSTNSRSQGYNEKSNLDIICGPGECVTPPEQETFVRIEGSSLVDGKSQLSASDEEYVFRTEHQSSGTTSRSQCDNENSNIDIACGSGESMTPREADSSERNESAFESTAGSVISDRKGESLVDRLKRRIEYDKERIASLYKELDEERSASAIAANQAMAMITRLQEEKAALNMEAMHCLRGMEEQAEYDVEALEKANDLLSEKEKEIQDLEAELEHYRSKVSEGFIKEQKGDTICSSNDPFSSNVGCNAENREQKHPKCSNVPEIEEERLYILECLKRLELACLKLNGFGVAPLMSNGVKSEMMEERESNESQPGDFCEDNEFCNEKILHVSNGNIEVVEVNKSKTLESDESDKHDGLEEAEANHDCSDCSLKSHQMGREGLPIIEEIARQLQELRKHVLKGRYVVP